MDRSANRSGQAAKGRSGKRFCRVGNVLTEIHSELVFSTMTAYSVRRYSPVGFRPRTAMEFSPTRMSSMPMASNQRKTSS